MSRCLRPKDVTFLGDVPRHQGAVVLASAVRASRTFTGKDKYTPIGVVWARVRSSERTAYPNWPHQLQLPGRARFTALTELSLQGLISPPLACARVERWNIRAISARGLADYRRMFAELASCLVTPMPRDHGFCFHPLRDPPSRSYCML